MNFTKGEILSYIDKAIEIRERAYVPYSNFKVGALVITETGDEYYGVNIENASYGLSNCAERTAIFNAITNGMKKIKAIVIVGDTTAPISPCGACRQVISEFSTEETVIILSNLKREYKLLKVKDILPYAFEL